jgi:endonuclease/exonuclease/phosphatase family metal-dependent hydrolase
MIVSQDPLAFDDVRLTDFDVILVRKDVRVSDVVAKNYNVNLEIPGSGIVVLRGFVAIKAKIGYQAYRVANTHLEPAWKPEILPIQRAQAKELLTFLQGETLPAIITGDFNSDAPDGETYKDILSQGYTDIWTQNWLKHNPHGFTSGHDYDLLNPVANFTQRIDFIFVRKESQFFPKPVIGPVFAIVVGDEDFNRTPSGFWPSDHGGVVARFRFVPFGLLASATQ